jgi:hypothetical protein
MAAASGAADAADAIRQFKRACEGTRQDWTGAARSQWDSTYVDPLLVDATRAVDCLQEAERLIENAIKALGRS